MVLTLGAGLGWRFQGLVPWVGVAERLGLARVLGCSTHMWGIVRVDGLCMWRLRDPPANLPRNGKCQSLKAGCGYCVASGLPYFMGQAVTVPQIQGKGTQTQCPVGEIGRIPAY